ncbi:hypothetical protein G6F55_009552 [Rhizopus delemar]|nr:hypothetical protein G6F36_013230 [Rhizopus arrhizus]KAG1450718.1 hypothetical protein G6F55_009552 [Rhizopus delemar]KAG1505581.1 hypothetical protein G6F53_010155 [Rhizopus delemar]KAG1520750.1 hypothetical protein G6F52_007376 [Rhizopus delemar]KAG1549637.1 hypothetical protein G6F49_009535 [Rhizopus delemar]
MSHLSPCVFYEKIHVCMCSLLVFSVGELWVGIQTECVDVNPACITCSRSDPTFLGDIRLGFAEWSSTPNRWPKVDNMLFINSAFEIREKVCSVDLQGQPSLANEEHPSTR